MKAFFAFIKKSLSEDNGNPSTTRLNTFYLFIQWVPVITFGFYHVLTHNPELVLAYLTIMTTGIFGILGLKVWQKGKEAPTPESTGGSNETAS